VVKIVLLNAVIIKKVVDFIKQRELILFIESMAVDQVELLLAIKYEEINEFQNLLTADYLENYGIFGEASDGYFNANINNVIGWVGLRIEDFKGQIDVEDWLLYEKWLERKNVKTA